MVELNGIEEALNEWVKWEKNHSLYAPDNIREAETTQGKFELTYKSSDYQKDRELRYATSRAWKELEEALERAKAVDKADRDEKVDFKEHFEYTENDNNYSTDNLDKKEQLMDEYGFELADTALFILKMTTSIEAGFGSEDYEPDLETIAKTLEQTADPVQLEYHESTEQVKKLLEPDTEENLYEEVMGKSTDEQKIGEYAEEIIEKLSQLTAHLPKSLSDYVAEKIHYNLEQRQIEEMDADHPNPEKEFKRDFEKN